MFKNRKNVLILILIVTMLVFLLGCSNLVVVEDPKNHESEILTVINTPTSTMAAVRKNTDASTQTITPTVIPTPTVTPTLTFTPFLTLDLDIGPAIVIVAQDQDPENFKSFLQEVVDRDYHFADFTNFQEYDRPIIIIFDEMRTSKISDNQKELVEILSNFGTGVLAIITDTEGGPGANFLYDLINNRNWQHCIQSSRNYMDMYSPNDDPEYFKKVFGYFQFGSEGYLYPVDHKEGSIPGNYPTCAVPPFGKYSEEYINAIEDFNVWGENYPQVVSEPISILVSSTGRETYLNYLEVYPSIRELDINLLPY